jgi:hypothetical protein
MVVQSADAGDPDSALTRTIWASFPVNSQCTKSLRTAHRAQPHRHGSWGRDDSRERAKFALPAPKPTHLAKRKRTITNKVVVRVLRGSMVVPAEGRQSRCTIRWSLPY